MHFAVNEKFNNEAGSKSFMSNSATFTAAKIRLTLPMGSFPWLGEEHAPFLWFLSGK
jgi:hypothetical protein